MIRAQFRALAASESTTERSLHATRAEAQAAATAMAAELQEWIDTEEHPAQCARAREHGNPEPDREIAGAEVEVVEYMVGDDDITDDLVAQDIVEAVIGTPHVRWPTSRAGDRADRPMRLLFADTPVRGQWAPLGLQDSEQMLGWFVAHGLQYPDSARRARKHARYLEHERVRSQRREQYAVDGGRPLERANAEVTRLERELAAARQVLEAAQTAEASAARRRDENIQWHAEALAKRPGV